MGASTFSKLINELIPKLRLKLLSKVFKFLINFQVIRKIDNTSYTHICHFQLNLYYMAKKNKNKSPQSRQIDAQKRRDKRRNKRESKDDCDPDMKIQLEKIGLGLKEVEGDG